MRCEVCGTQLPGRSRSTKGAAGQGGRPARYCSGACRQRAFRQRTAQRRTPRTDALPSNGLPASLDAFVGRERELARLRTLLRSSRLLTLTGPGGVGKTRLAVELAGGVRGGRTGRAHLVELDALRGGELLAQTVAGALGVRERSGRTGVDALVHALGTGSTLLVLDNCEHLVEPCAQLAATLLARCPRLRTLATSREALRVPGEMVFRVGELSLPPVGADHDGAALRRSEAVRLFVERARTHDARFDPTPDDIRTMAEICRRLEGLPLAIELAAGRTGSLPLTGILHELDDQLSLLTDGSRTGPGRHRELGAAIDWSHRLLDPLEQTVFRRLSVLGGGFDAEGAAAVCLTGEEGPAVVCPADGEGAAAACPADGDGADAACSADGAASAPGRQRVDPPLVVRRAQILRVVCALEAKSLLVRVRGDEHGGAARFRQLAAIRAYGMERLADAGELHATWSRALAWLAGPSAMEAAAPVFPDTAEVPLARERENLAAAVAYTAAHHDGRYIPLAIALARLHYQQEQLTAARTLLSSVLERAHRSEDRCAALALAARSACQQADHTAARTFADSAVALARTSHDINGLANALDALAAAHLCRGEFSDAVAVFREVLDVVRTLDRPLDLALCRHHLAWALLQTGRTTQAAELMAASLPALEADAPPGQLAAALHTAGAIRLAQGDLGAAERTFAEVLLMAPTGESLHALYPVEGLALVAAERGDPERALRLYAAAAAARRRIDTEPEEHWREQVAAAVAAARGRLHPAGAHAAMAAGRRLRGERLVAYALRGTPLGETSARGSSTASVSMPYHGDHEVYQDHHPADSAGFSAPHPPLTGRESAVAKLVAEGMTNQQIASHLGLSKSTVASHLDRVRDKLGVRSRAQIAVRVAGEPGRPG